MKIGTCARCHRIELMIASNGYCRECGAAYKREQRHAGKVKTPTACVKCKRDDVKLYKSNGYCKECWKAYMDAYREKGGERVLASGRDTARRYNLRIRSEVLAAYGGKCACCGETNSEFLAMDHINGNGARERMRDLGTHSSAAFYRYIKREHPTDLQVLCHNCNQSISIYGTCPHGTLPPRPVISRGWKNRKFPDKADPV